MVFDALFVLTGLKPGLDAFRVASGAEKVDTAVVDPMFELAVMKALELVCEAIPGYVPAKQPLAPAPPS
jgi:hypothetical protein